MGTVRYLDLYKHSFLLNYVFFFVQFGISLYIYFGIGGCKHSFFVKLYVFLFVRFGISLYIPFLVYSYFEKGCRKKRARDNPGR